MTLTTLFSNLSSVLIIKPRAIGDVLLSTPVISQLHDSAPDLSIDFLCETFAADVITGNPHIRNVITFNKKNDSTVSIIRSVRKSRYDAVIDLFGNPRTALITRFSGAPVRIGFPFRGRKYAYTIHIPPRGNEVHNVEFNLEVLRHIGIPVKNPAPFFPVGEDERNVARNWISDNGLSGQRLVGINAGGGWYTKKWRPVQFAALADELAKRYGLKPLFFWGPGERDEVESIRKMMKQQSQIIPATTLKEMGAFLEQCSYLVSNDSGPMHISAALDVPTLGIYGPTNPLLQGPFGEKHRWVRHEELDCLACNLTKCPIGNICMEQLPVSIVLKAFDELQRSNPL